MFEVTITIWTSATGHKHSIDKSEFIHLLFVEEQINWRRLTQTPMNRKYHSKIIQPISDAKIKSMTPHQNAREQQQRTKKKTTSPKYYLNVVE